VFSADAQLDARPCLSAIFCRDLDHLANAFLVRYLEGSFSQTPFVKNS
jgi:hypothetical protein